MLDVEHSTKVSHQWKGVVRYNKYQYRIVNKKIIIKGQNIMNKHYERSLLFFSAITPSLKQLKTNC